MTKKVWKYLVPTNAYGTVIEFPGESPRIVHVAMHFGVPSMWVEVDPDSEKRWARRFQWYGTGHLVPGAHQHIATVQDGVFVWHLYEDKS